MKGGDMRGWIVPLFPVEFRDVRRNLVQYWRLEWVVVDGIIGHFVEVGNV